MDDPIWISEELATAIHSRQLAEHGGADGLRDKGLFQSALARPRQLFAYSDPTPTIPALAAAYAAENWSEVDRLVSDDVVRRHAACGTPQQVRDKLEEYRAIGLDEVVLGGLDDAAAIAATLKAIDA